MVLSQLYKGERCISGRIYLDGVSSTFSGKHCHGQNSNWIISRKVVLASTGVSPQTTSISLSFVPTSSTVSLVIGASTPPFKWVLKKYCKCKKIQVEQSHIVRICDDIGDKYRYGFNGMEKDNELKGIGNSLDFGARIYDSRVGRFLSVDPKFKLQPGQSTYKAFLNNPIIMIDPDGETEYITTINFNKKTGNTTVTIYTDNSVMTDGIQHRVWTSNSSYHFENYYYDYSTIIYQTTNTDGTITKNFESSRILKSNGVKDKDNVYFGGNKKGDTKIESWNKMFDLKEYVGGIMIYGSATSGNSSPGDKKFTGKLLGTFDFAAFSKVFDLITVGMDNPSIFDKKFDIEGARTTLQSVDKAIEQIKIEDNRKKKVCNNCNKILEKNDTSHNTVGEGTRDTTIIEED